MLDTPPRAAACPECLSTLEPGDRFCQVCGLRAPRQIPWAPVFVVTGALAVFVILLMIVMLRSDDSPDSTTAAAGAALDPTTTSTTTHAVSRLTVLSIAEAVCSSELPDFPCSLAVDGDTSTAWNAPAQGRGAEITLQLGAPAQVSRVVIENHSSDEPLLRNARIQDVQLHFDGSAEVVVATLEGGHGPYRIDVPLIFTAAVVIHVDSVYPAEHFGDLEPFDELAVAEIGVIGFTR